MVTILCPRAVIEALEKAFSLLVERLAQHDIVGPKFRLAAVKTGML